MDKGSIAFFPTYRPPVPLDIYSCPATGASITKADETPMITEEKNTFAYNYNATLIPPNSLKKLITRSELASKGIYKAEDVDSGRLSGLVFVSERGEVQHEILHIALRLNDKVEVFSLAEIFGTTDFDGLRMEDSGCFTDDYLVYVSTKKAHPKRRQPWTAVYKTHLTTGKTDRITPEGQADLSPSVSKSGKMIAVASFQRGTEKESGWMGEIEDLRTNIYVIDVENPTKRKLVVENGGWPTWGSDSVLFFHRNLNSSDTKKTPLWAVFRFKADISKILNGGAVADVSSIQRVLPEKINGIEVDARTPAAIDENRVAVATIRLAFNRNDLVNKRTADQYRHIEIFQYSEEAGKQVEPIQITAAIGMMADHYNPFVIHGSDRIGYHRVNMGLLEKSGGDLPRQFQKLESPDPRLGLFRVSGVFPTFSTDGKRLAFVDNEFKSVWVADKKGLRVVYKTKVNNFFAPVWNQNPDKDTLYVCEGPAFSAKDELHICAIKKVSAAKQTRQTLTKFANNAFPSSSPDGKKLVFRSTRDYLTNETRHKNLYIMEDAEVGEWGDSDKPVTRLTFEPCTDTHCSWSPKGDWIVYSSTLKKPAGTPPLDFGLDPGYFAIYLLSVKNPDVIIKVAGSGDGLAGHMNHPFFSPKGDSIVVTADLAAVSCDPVSLPLFVHSVRPYGDIFTIDIDKTDIKKNEDLDNFKRITHSRYEYSTASWTEYQTTDPNAAWNLELGSNRRYTPSCPYAHPGGAESWHMTGHLCLGHKRCC